MCRDHEALRFRYDAGRGRVVGRITVIDGRYAPYGCLDATGSVTHDSIGRWVSSRAIPMTRPSAEALVRDIGFESTEGLMLAGLGLSLSDQYWLRPQGSDACWGQVSLFGRGFSREVGEMLLPHDDSSARQAKIRVRSNSVLLSSSPDTALSGNLPKRWKVMDGRPVLLKSGKREHLLLEPFFEAAASRVLSLILEKRLREPHESGKGVR